ncbi:unnamed protein product [Lactuca saligna]|uniref:RRM domain-containing protein n=1 Tax=Lactuca saligna TaxID=75948 RepID=A0AA35YTW8_LACSI|nr:unnamed protein product [Lactuca saligna]
MLVSNFPSAARKDILKRIFEKFGSVVDIYMTRKMGANRKTFAFVRFKKTGDEQELEKSLQGVKYRDHTMEVNIARFERRPVKATCGQYTNSYQNRSRPQQTTRFKGTGTTSNTRAPSVTPPSVVVEGNDLNNGSWNGSPRETQRVEVNNNGASAIEVSLNDNQALADAELNTGYGYQGFWALG